MIQSTSKPNIQNILVRTKTGREVREAFTESEPPAFDLDFQEMEERILALMTPEDRARFMKNPYGA